MTSYVFILLIVNCKIEFDLKLLRDQLENGFKVAFVLLYIKSIVGKETQKLSQTIQWRVCIMFRSTHTALFNYSFVVFFAICRLGQKSGSMFILSRPK